MYDVPGQSPRILCSDAAIGPRAEAPPRRSRATRTVPNGQDCLGPLAWEPYDESPAMAPWRNTVTHVTDSHPSGGGDPASGKTSPLNVY